MYNILKERNKSIRARWMIDFSLLILIICMINYIVVSLIYKDLLKEKEEERSRVAINAIITQTGYSMSNADAILSNLMKCDFIKDEALTLEEKVNRLEGYFSPFYDMGLMDTDGNGATIKGGQFTVKNSEVFHKALIGEIGKYEIIEYNNQVYLLYFRPVLDEKSHKKIILIGARKAEDVINQILEVSSGDECFIANRKGKMLVGRKEHNSSIYLYKIDESIEQLFESELLIYKEYTQEIKDTVSGEISDVSYGAMGSTGWILGIANNRNEGIRNLNHFRLSMLIGMGIVVIIGGSVVFINANSITKRMLYIVGHMTRSIETEFKESMPNELLLEEDELGELAREMNKLEEEIAGMLVSIKDSVNYLNEKVECIKNEDQR